MKEASPSDDSTDGLTRQVDGLQQRIHRLEDAVAGLQDTHLLEERLVVRVVERINGNLPYPRPIPPG